jgi:hypothetical protein
MGDKKNDSNISYSVDDLSGNKSILVDSSNNFTEIVDEPRDWFKQSEYIIFRNELNSLKKINLVVLKECKENKRLLDLKYDDLTHNINNIQTSVIFFSTISGFLQATRVQFSIPDDVISIISIFISTYISLLLSISKYYKLDEVKERIQTLREKFSILHNKLDYRMDVIGPWNDKNIWKYQDPKKKLAEWTKLQKELTDEYEEIIQTKKELVTEFQIIMDTIARNTYNIINRERNYENRKVINNWDHKEHTLEQSINKSITRSNSIKLQHEELNNWETDSEQI